MTRTVPTIPPISLVSADILVLILDSVLIDCAVSNGDPIACGPEDDTILATSQVIRRASQVCKFWRSVCLTNPLWWSTISIVHPWRLEEVTTCLERAQQCPLDLRIFGDEHFTTRTEYVAKGFPDHFTPTIAMYKVLFEVIFPILPRCRVLHLRGVFTGLTRALPFEDYLERIVDTPMDILEHLIFEGDLTHYENDLNWWNRRFFSAAPKLQHLRLIGVGIHRFPFHLPSSTTGSTTSSKSLYPSRSPPPVFSSRTLTTLHLSHGSASLQTTFAQLKSTLTACPSLLTVGIYDGVLDSQPDISSIPEIPDATQMTCEVPSLKSLYILGNTLSVSEILLFLHAPKMTELVIAPTVYSDLRPMIEQDQYVDPNISPPETRSAVLARAAKISTDRYPSLTQLTLALGHPLGVDGSLHRASVCFPLIKRLILVFPERGFIDAVHDSFSSAEANEPLGGEVLFPNLVELGLHLDLDIDPPLQINSKYSRAYIQYRRLAAWANSITAVRHARETVVGIPFHKVYVDSDTFRAFKFYAKDSGVAQMETEDTFDMPDVEEANIWEEQRRRMLFTQVKDLFLGHSEEGL